MAALFGKTLHDFQHKHLLKKLIIKHLPQSCKISKYVVQILLNDLSSNNIREHMFVLGKIYDMQKSHTEWTLNTLYSTCKMQSIPVPTKSIMANLRTIMETKQKFVKHVQSTRCCINSVQNTFQIIEKQTIQCLKFENTFHFQRKLKRMRQNCITSSHASLCKKCAQIMLPIKHQCKKIIIDLIRKILTNESFISSANDDLRNCTISTDIFRFFLEELTPSNSAECISEIHNMKSLQEWTFAQLYRMCTNKLMNIPEESALAKFNVIIQNNLYRNQIIKNMPCSASRCANLIKNMNQFIEKKTKKCLQIKNSPDGRKNLNEIKCLCKKKSMKTTLQDIAKCQQQCPEIAKICKSDNATIVIIVDKIQKSFWGSKL